MFLNLKICEFIQVGNKIVLQYILNLKRCTYISETNLK